MVLSAQNHPAGQVLQEDSPLYANAGAAQGVASVPSHSLPAVHSSHVSKFAFKMVPATQLVAAFAPVSRLNSPAVRVVVQGSMVPAEN